jgi:hypothetical protein
MVNASGGWDPTMVRVGIIAILIGLRTQPVPALSYQDGDDLVLRALDGGAGREVARVPVPPQASGFMEEEGISYYFILPYIEQDNVYRGTVGQGAVPVL